MEMVNTIKHRYKIESKEDLIKGLGLTYDEFNYWEKAFEANNIQSLDNAYQ